jgi:D-lactate dehydrogenase (cytochrome)
VWLLSLHLVCMSCSGSLFISIGDVGVGGNFVALSDLQTLNRNEDGIHTAISVLKQQFGEQLKTSQAYLEQHAHTMTYIPSQLPDAVVFARTTQDVQDIVRVCADYKVPIIPFGTGTSLEGGVNAPAGGISIDLNEMNKVLSVNVDDLDCVVQPGVTREALNEYLRGSGLFFPIDPGANASLGGMAATRASGTNTVRYGTMRENVVTMTVVMPDGRAVKTASRTRKTSAGYDLTKLMVGSEGTLGIITELTLRLHGIPDQISAGICQFETIENACNACILAMQVGLPLARIELLDSLQVEMVNQYSGLTHDPKPTLFLEFHGTEAGVNEQIEIFTEIANDFGGGNIQWEQTTEARNKLWKARHDAYYAMLAWRKGCNGIATDACVPISRLAECLSETQKDAQELDLVAPIVGHVGDGNFHITPLVMMDDADEVARAEEFIERLNMRAIAMEGTCTGEHGIGQGKRRFLRLEHGVGADIMASIKKAIDPDNIMNPGKVVGYSE